MITIRRALIALAALTIVLSAQAADTNQGIRRVHLSEEGVLLGVPFEPGSYTLRWQWKPGSDEVRLDVLDEREVLAQASGRWIDSKDPSPYEALVYHVGADGKRELSEIRFEGRPQSIVVDASVEQVEVRAQGKN